MPATPPPITYYVVLLPQAPEALEAARPVSRLLKEDEATVRKKLATTTYHVINRFAKKANAEGQRGQLAALGVRTIVLSDQDIRGHLIIYAAAATQGGGGLAFRDFKDAPLFCAYKDLIGAALYEVNCEDGNRANLIDLHRRGTNITVRLDASLFDFSELLGHEDADLEEFLQEVERQAGITVDRQYASNREELRASSKDFASRPGEVAPPEGMILSPYVGTEVRAANVYSVVLTHKGSTQ